MTEQGNDPAITAAREAIRSAVEKVGGTCMGTYDHMALHPAITLGRQLVVRPRIEVYFFDEGRVDFETGWFIRYAQDISDVARSVKAIMDGQAEERITITPDGNLVEEGWTIWGPNFSIGERKPPRENLLVRRLPSWESIRQMSPFPGPSRQPPARGPAERGS